MPKQLFVIANPSAGTGDAEATVNELKAHLSKRKLSFQLELVATPQEASNLCRQIKLSSYAAVAVYGGDGTVIAVLKELYKAPVPVLILPGGSANALAKALNLPTDVGACLDLFLNDTFILRYFAVSKVGEEPLILDLHFGIWAAAIKSTPQKHKQLFGQLAYGAALSKQLVRTPKFSYELALDDRKLQVAAYACMVANEGVHNVLGAPLFPRAHVKGLLQVAFIKRANWLALMRWYLRRRVGLSDPQVIETHVAKKVEILRAPSNMLVDDTEQPVKLPLTIKPTPYSVTVIAPSPDRSSSFRRIWLRFKTAPMRHYDHWRRRILGGPLLSTSQIYPNLYVGGQYRRYAARRMKEWGITGVVNMRQLRRPPQTPGLEVLNLPTPDHQAPSINALHQGVAFISRHIAEGGGVYVHCRLGEGRGPTMAAAYLVSQGMRTKDAIAHLERYRPLVRPNAKQIRQLARFESELDRK